MLNFYPCLNTPRHPPHANPRVIVFPTGLFGVGVVAALWLVLPAALRMVGRESAASSAWPIDLGLILGCLGSAVGVRTVHCLGGSWAVWLVGWWLWCSAGACLYGLSGLRRLGSVVLTLGVSVALPAACGLLPFTPAAVPLQMALEGPMLAAQQRVVNALLALKSALTV